MSGSWRRSRPFWGGLLILAAGLELLSIPFATRALPLVIQSGTVGATYLIALVLVILGLMIWLQPGQRAFLGVVAVLVSIASFVYANLGGFLIGMLLGLVGGALAVAWAPGETAGTGTAPPGTPGPPKLAEGAIFFTERRVVRGDERLDAGPAGRRDGAGSGGEDSGGEMSGGEGGARPGDGGQGGTGPGPPAQALAVAVAPLILLTGTGAARQDPGVVPTAKAAVDVAVEAAAVHASSLTMTGMKFTGVVDMPTATGSVKMLRFTMDRAVLERPRQTMGSTTLAGATFTFEGDVVICTTKMTAKLLGVRRQFTAEHPNLLVRALRLVPSLNVPLTMTDVVSEQPYVTADSLRADDLRLVVGA